MMRRKILCLALSLALLVTALPFALGEADAAGQTRRLRLGSSIYTIEIDASYVYGEMTEEDVAVGQVAYLYSDSLAVDFDIYQFENVDGSETLEAFVNKKAGEKDNVEALVTDGVINGIPAGWFRTAAMYNGVEYQTVAYILGDGDEFVEIVFWLDGEDAEARVQGMMNTLAMENLIPIQLGSSPYWVFCSAGFHEGGMTSEDVAEHQVAYWVNDDAQLDFVVYCFGKAGLPERLADYVAEEAASYESVSQIVPETTVNGIPVGWYRTVEEYEGKEYNTLTCVLDAGQEYVEIVFWPEGLTASSEADAILQSLWMDEIDPQAEAEDAGSEEAGPDTAGPDAETATEATDAQVEGDAESVEKTIEAMIEAMDKTGEETEEGEKEVPAAAEDAAGGGETAVAATAEDAVEAPARDGQPPVEGITTDEAAEGGEPVVESVLEASAEGEEPVVESVLEAPAEDGEPAVESVLEASAEGEEPVVESVLEAPAEDGEPAIESALEAPAEGEKEVAEAGDEATKTIRLGTSAFVLTVPAGFTEGEMTQEDIDDDQVAYYYSKKTPLDFDVYQFSKDGYPNALAEYAAEEVNGYNEVSQLVTDGEVNGIPAAWYRTVEVYQDASFNTLTYILDGGDEYVEIVFWLDGDNADAEADAIVRTLSISAAEDTVTEAVEEEGELIEAGTESAEATPATDAEGNAVDAGE